MGSSGKIAKVTKRIVLLSPVLEHFDVKIEIDGTVQKRLNLFPRVLADRLQRLTT